jgi:ribosomal protein S18 acetylase RimI-like enzyme
VSASFTVRRGELADREFVRDLGRRSAATSVSPVREARHADVLDAFERLVDFVYTRKADVLIAEDGEVAVGFLLLLYDVPDEVTLTQQAFVAYTAVEPFARGRGAGRAMLDAAEVLARRNGMRYVSLMVTDDNTPARALYARSGFVTERRMMTKPL